MSAKVLLSCVALGLFAILPAGAQQAEPLEQQLQDLKQEYETTTQAMQLRIAALEQQIESQKESSEKAKAFRMVSLCLKSQWSSVEHSSHSSRCSYGRVAVT